MFRSAMHKCLDERVFQEVWKLVILPKPGKPSGDPSANRQAYWCLIDMAGKVLEKRSSWTECRGTPRVYMVSRRISLASVRGGRIVHAIRSVRDYASENTWVRIRWKLLPKSSISLRHRGGSDVLPHKIRIPTWFHPGFGVMDCHVRRSVQVKVPSA